MPQRTRPRSSVKEHVGNTFTYLITSNWGKELGSIDEKEEMVIPIIRKKIGGVAARQKKKIPARDEGGAAGWQSEGGGPLLLGQWWARRNDVSVHDSTTPREAHKVVIAQIGKEIAALVPSKREERPLKHVAKGRGGREG